MIGEFRFLVAPSSTLSRSERPRQPAARLTCYNVTAGVPILIRVGADTNGAPFGPASAAVINISQAPARPVNDNCVNAIEAQLGLNAFDTTEATIDGTGACDTSVGRDL